MATWRLPSPPPKPTYVAPAIDFESGSKDAAISVQAEGLAQLEERLRALPKTARDGAGAEMSQIMHEVVADAQANYVPFDTGALHDSGRSDEYDPQTNATIIEIAAWFGGTSEAGVSGVDESGGGGGAHMPSDMDRLARAGAMRASHTSRMKSRSGTAGEMGASGSGGVRDPSQYALEQHENMSYRHPGGGGPKYLEIPFTNKMPSMAPRIAEAAGMAIQWANGGGVWQLRAEPVAAGGFRVVREWKPGGKRGKVL